MKPDSSPFEIHLPSLSDETVVAIQDFLYECLDPFESRYGDQIHRFYQDQAFDNLVDLSPRSRLPGEDPPF